MIALLVLFFITIPILVLIIGLINLGGTVMVETVQEYAKPIHMRGANNITNPEWEAWHKKHPWTPAERDDPDAWRHAKVAEGARNILYAQAEVKADELYGRMK